MAQQFCGDSASSSSRLSAFRRDRPSSFTSCFAGCGRICGSGSARQTAAARKRKGQGMRRPSILDVLVIENFRSNMSEAETDKTEGDRSLIKSAITMNKALGPLVADLSVAALHSIVDLACRIDVDEGEVIMRQGDQGNLFYVVGEGRVEYSVDGKKVGEAHAGESFGELALLNLADRKATVKAMRKTRLWSLQRGCLYMVYAKPLREKLASYVDALGRVELLRNKSEGLRQKLADSLQEVAFTKGEYIYKEKSETKRSAVALKGDMNRRDSEEASGYLLYQGELIIEVNGVEKARIRGDPEASPKICPSFGLTEVINGVPRATSVKVASRDAVILVLNPSVLLEVGQSPELSVVKVDARQRWKRLKLLLKLAISKRRQAYTELLSEVELFKTLPESVRSRLALKFETIKYYKTEYIFKQGDFSDACYVLYRGAVAAEKDGHEIARLVGDPEQCQAPCFGTRSMGKADRRLASMKVMSEECTMLRLDRDYYLETFADKSDDVEYDMVGQTSVRMNGKGRDSRNGGASSDSSHRANTGQLIEYRREDLENRGVLGCGGFGSVQLVKHGPTGQHFALKSISKGYVEETGTETCVMNEKEILRLVNSPFLVRAAATFNSKQHVFFLMELALGGEVFSVCERYNLFGEQEHMRFFAACVVQGLEHIHTRNIIYRDLKPENLLLDYKGYVKVTDFGFAKLVVGRTGTMCGTPQYFAPEVVNGVPYNVAVDWWSLGVLIYELNTGVSPFDAAEMTTIFAKIKIGWKIITFPPKSESWQDIVLKLCDVNPDNRLPMRRGGLRNIELHPWYSKRGKYRNPFDWIALSQRKLQAPFVPEVTNPEELAARLASEESPEPPPFVAAAGAQFTCDWASDFEDRWGPKFVNEDDLNKRSSVQSVDTAPIRVGASAVTFDVDLKESLAYAEPRSEEGTHGASLGGSEQTTADVSVQPHAVVPAPVRYSNGSNEQAPVSATNIEPALPASTSQILPGQPRVSEVQQSSYSNNQRMMSMLYTSGPMPGPLAVPSTFDKRTSTYQTASVAQPTPSVLAEKRTSVYQSVGLPTSAVSLSGSRQHTPSVIFTPQKVGAQAPLQRADATSRQVTPQAQEQADLELVSPPRNYVAASQATSPTSGSLPRQESATSATSAASSVRTPRQAQRSVLVRENTDPIMMRPGARMIGQQVQQAAHPPSIMMPRESTDPSVLQPRRLVAPSRYVTAAPPTTLQQRGPSVIIGSAPSSRAQMYPVLPRTL